MRICIGLMACAWLFFLIDIDMGNLKERQQQMDELLDTVKMLSKDVRCGTFTSPSSLLAFRFLDSPFSSFLTRKILAHTSFLNIASLMHAHSRQFYSSRISGRLNGTSLCLVAHYSICAVFFFFLSPFLPFLHTLFLTECISHL